MNTIYIGVDFHARQQTICYLTTDTGEVQFLQLQHHDKQAVRSVYAQFTGQVIVGLEASGYSPWFEQLLAELGCEVWLGNAKEIRRRARSRHKNDRRDAELILELMLHDEFPRLYMATVESREVLRMLRYRQKLIKMRTMVKNSLQALALQSGLAKGSRLFSKAGLQELRCAPMSPVMQWQREQWLQLLEGLNQRVLEVMQWLQQQSANHWTRIVRIMINSPQKEGDSTIEQAKTYSND
jgi:transposase